VRANAQPSYSGTLTAPTRRPERKRNRRSAEPHRDRPTAKPAGAEEDLRVPPVPLI